MTLKKGQRVLSLCSMCSSGSLIKKVKYQSSSLLSFMSSKQGFSYLLKPSTTEQEFNNFLDSIPKPSMLDWNNTTLDPLNTTTLLNTSLEETTTTLNTPLEETTPTTILQNSMKQELHELDYPTPKPNTFIEIMTRKKEWENMYIIINYSSTYKLIYS